MDNGIASTGGILRVVGTMCVCVGIAWALQVLGLDRDSSALDRMAWVLAAAAIAGAGAGAIFTAAGLRDEDGAVRA